MGLLETLRRWVDGEDAEDALSRAAAEQARPRRQAEEYIVTIAREIGEVMKAEAVPLPPDQIVIPPEYVVFISDEDDREWQGMKRRALEQGLYHVLAEHARELAGKTKLATTAFSVELRVDGTLNKGEVRVQHSWEETSSTNKTSITPRKTGAQPPVSPHNTTPVPPTPNQAPAHNISHQQPVNFEETLQSSQPYSQQQIPPTVFAPTPNFQQQPPNQASIEQMPNQTGGLDTEATQVKKRELYRLEVWRNNQRQMVVPVFQPQISIGRKSVKIPSDIQLEGDPEVSRPHLMINRDTEGKFWIIHKGKNPTIVGGREAPAGQPFPVAPGEPIAICSFLLRIQS